VATIAKANPESKLLRKIYVSKAGMNMIAFQLKCYWVDTIGLLYIHIFIGIQLYKAYVASPLLSFFYLLFSQSTIIITHNHSSKDHRQAQGIRNLLETTRSQPHFLTCSTSDVKIL
jgi:hypothetical protein